LFRDYLSFHFDNRQQCDFDERQQSHFDERQRGEILIPAEKISRIARFLASLEMAGGRGQERESFFNDENPCQSLPCRYVCEAWTPTPNRGIMATSYAMGTLRRNKM